MTVIKWSNHLNALINIMDFLDASSCVSPCGNKEDLNPLFSQEIWIWGISHASEDPLPDHKLSGSVDDVFLKRCQIIWNGFNIQVTMIMVITIIHSMMILYVLYSMIEGYTYKKL